MSLYISSIIEGHSSRICIHKCSCVHHVAWQDFNPILFLLMSMTLQYHREILLEYRKKGFARWLGPVCTGSTYIVQLGFYWPKLCFPQWIRQDCNLCFSSWNPVDYSLDHWNPYWDDRYPMNLSIYSLNSIASNLRFLRLSSTLYGMIVMVLHEW